MRIDFIADVICPWCWLGWVRLHKGLALRPEVKAEVLWRAYQLDPTVPEEGVDRAAYTARRFPDPEARRAGAAALQAEAEADGLTLNLGAIARHPNTNGAHRIIRWAQGENKGQTGGQGRQADAALALFDAYFAEGRDIGDPEVLADCGTAAGLERMAVLDLLARGVDRDAVAAEHASAVEAGVSGVPFAVFDGRAAVIGAQSPERYAMAVDRALAKAAAA